jgi:hypothetical protein
MPGGMAGYALQVGPFDRSINDCIDCTVQKLPDAVSGLFATPFVRATFGSLGNLAVCVRSQWFITGALQQATFVGFEYGMP